MTCESCGSTRLTPHVAWADGAHKEGFQLCEDCGNEQVDPTFVPVAAAPVHTEGHVNPATGEPDEMAADVAARDKAEAANVLIDGTVPDVADRLADEEDVARLEAALEAEEAGKNRAGVVSAIEARIAELEEE